MPVERKAWSEWLGQETSDPDRLKAMLSPYPTTGMVSWLGSPRGGNVKNNDPGPIEPVSVLGHFSFGGTP